MSSTGNVLSQASNGISGSSANSGGSGPASICSTVTTNCQALKTLGCAVSGDYTIDPDGGGSLPPMTASCDMTYDGGGWTLALNYVHQGGTNPALNIRSTSLPLLGTGSLGNNESGSATWGHASTSLMTALNFTEARHYCVSSSHTRVMHFKTSATSLLNWYRNGVVNQNYSTASAFAFTAYGDHTAVLPGGMNYIYYGSGDLGMTYYPFFKSGNAHWAINADNLRWECDDFPNSSANSTLHRIWVR